MEMQTCVSLIKCRLKKQHYKKLEWSKRCTSRRDFVTSVRSLLSQLQTHHCPPHHITKNYRHFHYKSDREAELGERLGSG